MNGEMNNDLRHHIEEVGSGNVWRVNCFFGHTLVQLDDNWETARDVFSKGNCHSFALAVAKLTGWELCAKFYREGNPIPGHVFVKTPDGKYFDVEGLHDPEAFMKLWNNRGCRGEIKPINKWHIRALVRKFKKDGEGYIPTRVKDAIKYAEMGLKRYRA